MAVSLYRWIVVVLYRWIAVSLDSCIAGSLLCSCAARFMMVVQLSSSCQYLVFVSLQCQLPLMFVTPQQSARGGNLAPMLYTRLNNPPSNRERSAPKLTHDHGRPTLSLTRRHRHALLQVVHPIP